MLLFSLEVVVSKIFTDLKLAGVKRLEGNLGKRKMNSKETIPREYFMKHSDISVTMSVYIMNVYTHRL